MSNPTAGIKDQATAAAKELEAEFLAALKGHVPAADEQAALTWATQTLAAAPFLLATNPDVAEQAAKAKSVLANLAIAHAIEAERQTAALVQSAVSKFARIALGVLMAAAAA